MNSGFPSVFNFSACEDNPDYADGCPEHAAIKDYCKDQEDFMRKNCPKSCGYCTEGKEHENKVKLITTSR